MTGAAGCAARSDQDASVVVFPTPSLAAGELPLPELGFVAPSPRLERGCAGIGLADATLQGDAGDRWVAWHSVGGRRRDVTRPRGYRARFPDGLEILEESGAVVLRQGDQVEVACVGPDELLLLTPPFR